MNILTEILESAQVFIKSDAEIFSLVTENVLIIKLEGLH
jgi:hypothetical protein